MGTAEKQATLLKVANLITNYTMLKAASLPVGASGSFGSGSNAGAGGGGSKTGPGIGNSGSASPVPAKSRVIGRVTPVAQTRRRGLADTNTE